ncbi:MAG: carbamoyl phosphate synthase small subunit [Candidatus Altiarchaeales archaeon WOR_SM1_86-2]|nr:MAG: carbamoyl phosphate synthase small subunit [Candidatus Altiarchaeales archaeon WOR_SM1_86-2]ODS40697.1 MAG: carbamoyl phosphate synthase small subunit [Candidatus Altiarchaeales archaeon WOR_SM1_79]
MKAVLALNDGTIFEGMGFGKEGTASGEVVFNTSMVGYEEALTDPSYKGQILTMTYPLIGNYGVRRGFFESDSIQVEGFVVRENSTFYSHRKARKSVDQFLKEHNIPGISGIDTRALTKKLRIHGVMNGALMVGDDADREKALKLAKKLPDISSLDLLDKVSVKKPKEFGCKGEKTTAVIDLGVKNSIIGYLLNKKVNVILMPHTAKPEEIDDFGADGILLSNGPGDPKNAKDAIKLVSELQSEYPINGVCLGHQVIGLALGAETYKLKFGHRGSNQPVKNIRENVVYITSQNHGFAVDERSVDGTGLKVSMINLNDGSVEGLCGKKDRIQGVQFHPEAGPGPVDCNYIFDRWVKEL